MGMQADHLHTFVLHKAESAQALLIKTFQINHQLV